MRVQRIKATDVLTRDGETAVLIYGRVLRLSALSAAVYELTRDPVDVETIAPLLEARFGPPSAGTVLAATTDAVADLVRHHVLRDVSD